MFAQSSSPTDLPSLSEILGRMPSKGQGDGKAASTAQSYIPGFASTASLLGHDDSAVKINSRIKDATDCDPQKYKNKGCSSKGKSKAQILSERGLPREEPVGKVNVSIDGNSNFKNVRARLDDTACANNKKYDVQKKARKRASGNKDPQQSTIQKPKIVKPGVKLSEGGNHCKKARKTKKIPSKPSIVSEIFGDIDQEPSNYSGLAEAVKRRRDWTPTKDTKKRTKAEPGDSTGHLNKKTSSKSITRGKSQRPSLERFGFQNSIEEQSMPFKTDSKNEVKALKKRKLDLIQDATHPNYVLEKSKRSISPAKKPQTITNKATAPFNSIEEGEGPSLFDYFAAHVPATLTESISKGKRSPLKVSKSKQSKKQTYTPLHSPQSAMRKMQDQDLVFGTSSQLIRDESPSHLRELQQAMRESEDAIAAFEAQEEGVPKVDNMSPGVLALAPTKNLWSAGARDFDNSLIASEPSPPRNENRDLEAYSKTLAVGEGQSVEADFRNIDSLVESPQTSQIIEPGAKTISHCSKAAQSSLTERLPTSIKVKQAKGKDKRSKKSSASRDHSEIPNYKGFTDAQLRKTVSGFGFKPVTRRNDMISLLERCWQSENERKQQRTNIDLEDSDGQVDSTHEIKTQASSLAKIKGKPAKTVTTTSTEISGIPTPKKRRGRPKKQPDIDKKGDKLILKTEGLFPRDISTVDACERQSRSMSELVQQRTFAPNFPEAHRNHLLGAITEAITSVPPTHDILSLTWHEKILLYDPIVIEDLTAWLNKEGLSMVGEDDEVSVFLVKEWCEGRSICCIWKETLRGKPRARW